MKKICFLVVMFVCLCGCGTMMSSGPNISALYRVPQLEGQLPLINGSKPQAFSPSDAEVESLFMHLYELDHTVALEIGRLPEFQKTTEKRYLGALRRFIGIMEKAGAEEKANLNNLLNVGKLEFRPYSTPLQSIIWLLETDSPQKKVERSSRYWAAQAWTPNSFKEESEEPEMPILRHSLEWLLDHAWDFSDKAKWGNFDEVTDRLNTPELVNYYEQAEFTYEKKYQGSNGFPLLIFKWGKGDCRDYTAFSVYCLTKGGYSAQAIKVVSPNVDPFHVVCEFQLEKGGTKFVMDNSRNMGIIQKSFYIMELPQVGIGYF
jgi:predicted transglutaminase-like cysteine proteinase